MNRNFERLIPGESRSCCNLEPTLSLSSLCRLSTICCRPALRALLLILPSSWLYTPFLSALNTGKLILQNQEGVWKDNWTWKSFFKWLLKIRGSSWQLRLHDFNDATRGPCASREYDGTAVKTANHHPPMATFWGGPQSIWLFIDNKINSERGTADGMDVFSTAL